MRRRPARGISAAGRWSSAACSSPPGRPTASRRPSATRASSRIRRRTRSRPSSTPACSACCSTRWCRSRSRACSALRACWRRPIVDGSGVAEAMGTMVGGSGFVTNILVMLMILALLLSIMTAMAGSSRTLYQGSIDGWLPRYLSHVNEHGAPTRAMWTDLVRQPGRAGDRLRRCDELLLHPRRVELRLHHLQLPQPQRRLDPSHRQRPRRASVAGADVAARSRHVCSRS